jgi:hypothetical protein
MTSVLTQFHLLTDIDGRTLLAGIICHKCLSKFLFLFVNTMVVCCTFDIKCIKIIKYYLSEMWKNLSFKNNQEKHFAGKAV